MGRIIRGTVSFEYELDDDPYFQTFQPEATYEERIEYFRDIMAYNLVAMSEGDGSLLRNFIEWKID